MASIGNIVDKIGTAIRFPEFGLSERLAGNKPTENTNMYTLAREAPGTYNKVMENVMSTPTPSPTQFLPEGSESVNSGGSTGTSTSTSTGTSTGSGLSSGGQSGPALPDNSRAIAEQNSLLSQLDPRQAAQIASLKADFDRIMGGYNQEATKNQNLINDQLGTARTNLDRGLQSIYLNSSQGQRGLQSILASLGGLSGSNVDLANRLVQNSANSDIGDINDTYRGNSSMLNSELDRFKSEDQKRRDALSGTLSNAEKEVQQSTLQDRQKSLQQLSNLFAEMGNDAEANNYAQQARALDAQITPLTVRSQALTPTSIAFTPQALSNYFRGGTSATVQQAPSSGAGLPNLLALAKKDPEDITREQA